MTQMMKFTVHRCLKVFEEAVVVAPFGTDEDTVIDLAYEVGWDVMDKEMIDLGISESEPA